MDKVEREIIEREEKVEFVEAWKLAEFTNELNKRFVEKYDEELNITLNTVNNYFRRLENEGIHYLNRLNGTKIYDELDMSIAVFIGVKRSKKLQKGLNWQLPQIFDEIGRAFKCRPESEVDMTTNQNDGIDLEKLTADLEVKITKIFEEKYKLKESQLLLEMKETKESINKAMIDIIEVQSKLKAEAIELWKQKPKSERFTGFLFKTEDLDKRDTFIDEYVNNKIKAYFEEKFPENEE